MHVVRAISFTETGEVHRIMDSEGVQRVPEALLQFTGLTDKNEKEIYEGIYCTRTFNDRGLACTFAVEYEAASGFIGGKTRGQNPKYCCVVIGNIYENSKLLASRKNC
jgi:hypothetical protein